jgi:leucine-rich repeat protein SHOC2
MPKKAGQVGGDKRLAFFDAIRKQKLETVRWSMRHGAQQVSTRDDDNMTCLMVCAAEGKPRSLDEILEFLGRQNSRRGGSSRSEAGEAVDGLELTNDDGHTALMLAARAGKKECAALLVKYGARLNTKNRSDGKTARDYCADKNYRAMVEWFDRGGKEEEREEDEEEVDDPNAVEGESASQRSRRLRREKEDKEAGRRGRKEEVIVEEEEEIVYIADADDKKEAVWPEVIKALASAETVQQTQKEVRRTGTAPAPHALAAHSRKSLAPPPPHRLTSGLWRWCAAAGELHQDG